MTGRIYDVETCRGEALDRFCDAKFEILDGFAQDKADLTATHIGILVGEGADVERYAGTAT